MARFKVKLLLALIIVSTIVLRLSVLTVSAGMVWAD